MDPEADPPVAGPPEVDPPGVDPPGVDPPEADPPGVDPPGVLWLPDAAGGVRQPLRWGADQGRDPSLDAAGVPAAIPWTFSFCCCLTTFANL